MRVPDLAPRGFYVSLVVVLNHNENGRVTAQPLTLHYRDPIDNEQAERDALNYLVTHPTAHPDDTTVLGVYATHTWEVRA